MEGFLVRFVGFELGYLLSASLECQADLPKWLIRRNLRELLSDFLREVCEG